MGLAREETGTRNKGGGTVHSGADRSQREAPLVPPHGYSSAEDDAGLSSSDIGANWNEKHNSLFGILASAAPALLAGPAAAVSEQEAGIPWPRGHVTGEMPPRSK